MIGQYLSNTNESATISILQKFLELNKALGDDNAVLLYKEEGPWASLLRDNSAVMCESTSP